MALAWVPVWASTMGERGPGGPHDTAQGLGPAQASAQAAAGAAAWPWRPVQQSLLLTNSIAQSTGRGPECLPYRALLQPLLPPLYCERDVQATVPCYSRCCPPTSACPGCRALLQPLLPAHKASWEPPLPGRSSNPCGKPARRCAAAALGRGLHAPQAPAAAPTGRLLARAMPQHCPAERLSAAQLPGP